jgi:cyclophilin family peptidyl-prolyl cis-trans isomerase
MRYWFRRWFGRSRRGTQQPARRPRPYRLHVENLEERCLLAASPTINPVQVPLSIPANKTLFLPVTASDPGGGTVTFSVSSNNANVTATQRTGDTFLQLNVATFGTMEFELFNSLAPRTVSYLTGLVEAGFYNGLTFHRVTTVGPTSQIAIIQGGDPNGDGSGGPPGPGATQTQLQQLQFPDEFDPSAIFSGTGQLAMANSGNDTNGSQFFVTLNSPRFLDLNHTIFGQLVRGFDVLSKIDSVPVDSNSKPTTPVVITSAQIVSDPSAAVFTVKSASATTGAVTLTVSASSSVSAETAATPLPVSGNVIADTANDPPILNVNSAPLNFNQAAGIPVTNLATPINTPVNFKLSSTDLEGNTPQFAVSVTETADATATVDASGNVTVTPTTGFTGLIHLQATVTESGSTRNNGPDAQNFTLAVGDKGITAATALALNTTEGTALTNAAVATFTDADTTSVPADFQATINWGDGTALDTTSGTITAGSAAGQFNVAGTHTYKMPGKYNVLVTVTDVHKSSAGGDNGGAMSQATTPATVADANLTATRQTVSATAGTALNNVVVATFTDADPNAQATNFTATIDWGDNTPTSTGTVAVASGGGFQVTGTHTYATTGTFAPAVTIVDNNPAGPNATAATATTRTLTALPQTVSGTVGTALTNVVLTTFTDTVASPKLSDYTATINWGDGSANTTGTVATATGGGFQVSGSHTYTQAGKFSPLVTITSANPLSTPGSVFPTATANITSPTATLTAQPVNVTGTAGTALTGVAVATFTDTVANPQLSNYTATINWGDGTAVDTTSATVTAGSTAGHFNVAGTHTYAAAGKFSPVVTITSSNTFSVPGSVAATATANIASATTTLTAQPVAVTGTVGTALASAPVATFTDTVANPQAANYTATIDWGDGSGLDSSSAVITPLGGGKFQVTGSHTYATAGTFSPVVTITSSNTFSVPGSVTVTPTATIVGTASQQYVKQLFHDLLGVAPTAQQLSSFSGQLDRGTSRLTVVHEIQALPGYQTHQIQLVYQALLGSSATTAQVNAADKFLKQHKDRIGFLRGELYASDAYFRIRGHGNASGYLSALAHDILGQPLDTASQASLSRLLAQGASLHTVLRDLVRSHQSQVAAASVQRVYGRLLQRAATPAEVAKALGLTEDDLIAALAITDEYFKKAQSFGSSSSSS